MRTIAQISAKLNEIQQIVNIILSDAADILFLEYMFIKNCGRSAAEYRLDVKRYSKEVDAMYNEFQKLATPDEETEKLFSVVKDKLTALQIKLIPQRNNNSATWFDNEATKKTVLVAHPDGFQPVVDETSQRIDPYAQLKQRNK